MAFKMKGSPMHMGTTSHASALKKDSMYKKAAALKKASALKDDGHGGDEGHSHGAGAGKGRADANGMMTINEDGSPVNNDGVYVSLQTDEKSENKTVTDADKKPASGKAYGGTKTWKEGQDDSGGTLNDTTNSQREYEKKMKADNPDWNKREDNDWKKRQNKINKALGSSKVYDTTKDILTKTAKKGPNEGEEVNRGVGSEKGKTLTTKQASEQKAAIGIQKDIKDDAREEGDKTKKTTANVEINRIRAGGDNEFTGTKASRGVATVAGKVNQVQLKNQAYRKAVDAWKEGGKEGPKPKRNK